MVISGFWLVFAFGSIGAGVAEVHKWYMLRESPNLPAYARSMFYWLVTFALAISGGFIAAAYGYDNANAIEKIQIGLSTPLAVKALASVGRRARTRTRGAVGRGFQPPWSEPSFIGFLSGA